VLLPFSFAGRTRPLSYTGWSSTVFFSQHLIALLLHVLEGQEVTAPLRDWRFYIAPLQVLVRSYHVLHPTLLLLGLACVLVAAWALAALTFRRAADANVTEWIAALVIMPVLQAPIILVMSALPTRTVAGEPAHRCGALHFFTAMQGLASGAVVTVLAVAVSALIFGSYGIGMFVASPLIIGATTGYLGNRRADIGGACTAMLVTGALLLGAVALVMFALEGLLCIILAAPLAVAAAVVGGFLGRAIALRSGRPPRQALSGLALFPLVFAAETVLPPMVRFDALSTILVSAPPEAVWEVLVRLDLSAEPVDLPFRLGVAYPLRGKVLGAGVGALRRGEFSTGVAIERVTEWVPNRKLAFMVLSDVPAMRELSPYTHVHAPHVVGYFRTTHTSFEVVPLSGGTSQVVLRTSHELRLDPAFYWLPLARWIVDENNARVLRHVRRRAERVGGDGGSARHENTMSRPTLTLDTTPIVRFLIPRANDTKAAPCGRPPAPLSSATSLIGSGYCQSCRQSRPGELPGSDAGLLLTRADAKLEKP